MASGLQISDGNGRILFDTSTSTGTVLGAVKITTSNYDPNTNPTTSNQEISVSVPQFASGRPFYFVLTEIGTYDQYLYPEPIVTINTNSISWVRGYIGSGTSIASNNKGYFQGTLFYGVY